MSFSTLVSTFEANLEAESRKFNRVLWILSDFVAEFLTFFDEISASLKKVTASLLSLWPHQLIS